MAIEITEPVDSLPLRRFIKAQTKRAARLPVKTQEAECYREWTAKDLRDAISEIIRGKDEKLRNVAARGLYGANFIVIHTDEWRLDEANR